MLVQHQTRGATPAAGDAALAQLHELVEEQAPVHADIGAIETPTAKQRSRFLVIRVSEGGTAKANIRIPLGLARAAMRFIPSKEKEHLKEQGIDIEEILGGLTGHEQEALIQVEQDDTSIWIGVE